jgi:hypothetical protein
MSLSHLASITLLCAVLFILLAAIGDTVATRQMGTERFRFVPFIRLLRRSQWPALVGGLAFVGLTLARSPGLAATAILAACIVGILSQIRLLGYGAVYQPLMRGFMPAFVVSMLVVNFPGLWPAAVPQLKLGMLEIGAAAMLAVGYWYVAHQRTTQDLIRLRD